MNSQSFRFSKNPILFWFVSLPGYVWMVTSGQTKRTYHTFSVPELFRTLFAPWKRDEVSTSNMSLGDKFRVMVGNMAGRFVAAIIRFITIFIGFGLTALVFLFGILVLTLVVVFPILVVLMFLLGVS